MDNDLFDTSEDHARLLDKFLVDNAELEELSAKLSIFNIFGTLQSIWHMVKSTFDCYPITARVKRRLDNHIKGITVKV